MYIVDSHCHLNFPQFKNCLDEVLHRAEEANVKLMQTICTKISEFEEIETIANKYKNIFCSVGIHPHEADKEKTTEAQLLELAKRPKVIGIGETGLDYFYKNSAAKAQKESFHQHINVSRELQIPLIIHTRDADEDTIKILQSEMKKGEFPALIHCFTATKKLAEAVLDMGIYISISGIVTFKNAKELQEIARTTVPLEKLLVETDAPFLAPAPHRGKVNEPAFTRHTLKFLAKLKGISIEDATYHTTNNFFKLFSKAKRV